MIYLLLGLEYYRTAYCFLQLFQVFSNLFMIFFFRKETSSFFNPAQDKAEKRPIICAPCPRISHYITLNIFNIFFLMWQQFLFLFLICPYIKQVVVFHWSSYITQNSLSSLPGGCISAINYTQCSNIVPLLREPILNLQLFLTTKFLLMINQKQALSKLVFQSQLQVLVPHKIIIFLKNSF